MKINSILIGKGKGSAGNVTVVQLKGQTILKQKASIVANPRTAGQIFQRNMVSRAVIAWQLCGTILKSGWTSLLPFCSEYNTYVSENSTFFKDATFTKEDFKVLNVLGSKATKGRLGVLSTSVDEIADDSQGFIIDSAQLSNIAKIGDKLKLVVGKSNSDRMVYSEQLVSADMLSGVANSVPFDAQLTHGTGLPIYAIWLESADGNASTTSTFVQG